MTGVSDVPSHLDSGPRGIYARLPMSVSLPVFGPDDTPTTPPPAAPAEARREGQLRDAHGRVIKDLRLSVTDRCNYRCVYCMDPGFRYMPKRSLLSFEEYVRVVRACRDLGVSKLRLTGGEPTLYADLTRLIEEVGTMGFDDIALTTNGSLFARMPLKAWREAGLTRVTFSLDSLRPDRVAAMTRTRSTADSVINAIHLAREAGLGPIKLNAVVMRGVNDDEVADFASFAREHEVDYRLIEFMPLDSSRAWNRETVVTAADMLEAITARHELVPETRADPHQPATGYRFADGSPGRVGIIAPVSRPFCGACSRLRITADGKVRPCLFSHDEWDLRPVLRGERPDSDVAQFIADSMWTKQAGHGINAPEFVQPDRTMSAIGG